MITNGYKNAYYYIPGYYIDNYYIDWGEYESTGYPTYESFGMIRGLFNKDVTIYTITEAVSTTGEIVKTESTGITIKARVMPISQRELYYANKNNLEITQKLFCDYSTWFNAKDRLVYDSETFEITGLKNPQESEQFLEVEYKRVS
jgi:SPP1 family predicted phage head-tail adaptor